MSGTPLGGASAPTSALQWWPVSVTGHAPLQTVLDAAAQQLKKDHIMTTPVPHNEEIDLSLMQVRVPGHIPLPVLHTVWLMLDSVPHSSLPPFQVSTSTIFA